MSLAARSIRGAAFLSAGTIINISVGFLGGILLARLLSPNDFGTFALAVTLNAFIDIRVKLQLEQKYLRDQTEGENNLNTFFTLSLGLSVISLCLLVLVALGAIVFARTDLAICLVMIGLLNLAEAYGTTIRLSIEKEIAFKAVSFIQVLANLFQFGGSLLGAMAGLGLWSLLLGQAINVLLGMILFWRIAPRRPVLYFDPALIREFLAYGLKYGIVYATAAIVITQFDNLILGLLGGTYALGFYDRAYRTSLWPTLLVSAALGRISLPTYAKLQDDLTRLTKAFSMVLWFVLTFTTPLALCVLVTAPTLVPVLYGDKWLPSVPILQVLAVFAVFRPLWDDMISILVATGRPGQMARVTFVQSVVLIGLAVYLTWFYGGVGTAISVGMTFLISAGFLFYFGRSQLGVNLWPVAGMPVLNNILTLTAYLVMRNTLPLADFRLVFQLIVEVTLWFGLYGLVTFLTSRRTVVGNVQYLIRSAHG